MSGGLWGKILRVDLSESTITEESVPDEWLSKFLGGRGLAMRYLIEDTPKGPQAVDVIGLETVETEEETTEAYI